MSLPSFTLMHKRYPDRGPRMSYEDPRLELVNLLPEDEEEQGVVVELNINVNLAETLLSTWQRQLPDGQTDVILPRDLANVLKILLSRRHVITAGIWDLGAFAAWLPSWLSVMNSAQGVFTFFQVRAAVPVGLVSHPKRIAALVRAQPNGSLSKKQRSMIQENIFAEEFFARATDVQRDTGVDYLIGITPCLIAGKDDEGIYWNRYSASNGNLILLSAQGLRSQAEAEGRDFEMAVSLQMLRHLLVAANPYVKFHTYQPEPKTEAELEAELYEQELMGYKATENRFCIFGYDEKDPDNISVSLRMPQIEYNCLRLMEPLTQHAAAALVTALDRPLTDDDASSQPPPSGSGPNIGNSSSSTYPSGSMNR